MAGELVFVTGGSSGIGLALIRRCPWAGARILDFSRRGAAGAEHVEVDLSAPGGWRTAAERFARELRDFRGSRVALLHSAGTLDPIGFAGEVDPAAYARAVLLNGASLPILGDAFLRALAGCPGRPRAWIVNIGSGAAFNVYEGWSAYCCGKAAADHWVRVAAAEQRRRASRCTIASIAPGVVETAMQQQIRAAALRDFPDLERFQELHEKGILRDPDVVGREIWEMLEAGLENGAVLDLRARQGG